MGRLLSLARGIETSLWSRLGRWIQEVATTTDQAVGDVSTLQTEMNVAQTDIAALQTDLGAAEIDIGVLQSDVAALQAPNRSFGELAADSAALPAAAAWLDLVTLNHISATTRLNIAASVCATTAVAAWLGFRIRVTVDGAPVAGAGGTVFAATYDLDDVGAFRDLDVALGAHVIVLQGQSDGGNCIVPVVSKAPFGHATLSAQDL